MDRLDIADDKKQVDQGLFNFTPTPRRASALDVVLVVGVANDLSSVWVYQNLDHYG